MAFTCSPIVCPHIQSLSTYHMEIPFHASCWISSIFVRLIIIAQITNTLSCSKNNSNRIDFTIHHNPSCIFVAYPFFMFRSTPFITKLARHVSHPHLCLVQIHSLICLSYLINFIESLCSDWNWLLEWNSSWLYLLSYSRLKNSPIVDVFLFDSTFRQKIVLCSILHVGWNIHSWKSHVH